MKQLFIVLLYIPLQLTLACHVFAGQIISCQDSDGKQLFTQTSCPSGYKEITKKTYVTAPKNESSESSVDLESMANEVSNNNRRLVLERKSKKAKQTLDQLKQERSNYQQNQYQLMNSVGGVNANNRAIAIEQQTLQRINQYDSQIAEQENTYRQMLDELKALVSQPNKAQQK